MPAGSRDERGDARSRAHLIAAKLDEPLGIGPIAYFTLVGHLSQMLPNQPHLCSGKTARSTTEAQACLWSHRIAAMIKKLIPGVVIATLACAQAEAQEPAPSQVSLSTPIDVRRMADWVIT
jgi:hypothetical protein